MIRTHAILHSGNKWSHYFSCNHYSCIFSHCSSTYSFTSNTSETTHFYDTNKDLIKLRIFNVFVPQKKKKSILSSVSSSSKVQCARHGMAAQRRLTEVPRRWGGLDQIEIIALNEDRVKKVSAQVDKYGSHCVTYHSMAPLVVICSSHEFFYTLACKDAKISSETTQ